MVDRQERNIRGHSDQVVETKQGIACLDQGHEKFVVSPNPAGQYDPSGLAASQQPINNARALEVTELLDEQPISVLLCDQIKNGNDVGDIGVGEDLLVGTE